MFSYSERWLQIYVTLSALFLESNYLKVSKEVVLEIVGCLGKATSKQVWAEVVSWGFKSKRKTVSIMLMRCRRQGLLQGIRCGRHGFVYRLLDSGRRRLRYKKDFWHETVKVPRVFAKAALSNILNSSDANLHQFAEILRLLWLLNEPMESIEVLALEILLDKGASSSSSTCELTENEQILFALYFEVCGERDYMSWELTQERAEKESFKKLYEKEMRKRSRTVSNRESQSPTTQSNVSIGRPIIEVKPVTPPSAIAFKQRPTLRETYSSGVSNYIIIPAPALLLAIQELISSAEKKILISAPHIDIPTYIIPELEKASNRGVTVTLITDDDTALLGRFGKLWNVKKDSSISLRTPLFIKDDCEVLAICLNNMPEVSFGIKFRIVDRRLVLAKRTLFPGRTGKLARLLDKIKT